MSGIGKASGKPLDASLVTSSFKSITFTLDPIASSLRSDVDHADAVVSGEAEFLWQDVVADARQVHGEGRAPTARSEDREISHDG